MTPFLLTPIVLATFATFTVAWLKRTPTRQFCPTCHHRTQTVLPPLWLQPVSSWLGLRWCADCNWQAVARKGPEWVPGKRVAHDSGFHWGHDVIGENQGFRWRSIEPEQPPEETPPHHPSGFRFAETEETPEAPTAKPDHPSGFSWAQADGTPPVERRKAAHPSGFLWGRRRSDRAGGVPARRRGGRGFFQWKKKGPKRDGRDGFHWGGAA